ncbi:unnamed protein product [Vitrella brassicaformis CCMP3155]|uniref:Sushi domain-containing protein n=3 Tax=Vitrella brassicaformis TaxID=1169539 RepID=A0A0G4GGD3_VITBC|nr:unnamed protein product [Vitrella brassicaformis CCMP3155]|eukprot:CEM28685.1 unnamed protein product [Vitrella brassicaformis CCMP3155]
MHWRAVWVVLVALWVVAVMGSGRVRRGRRRLQGGDSACPRPACESVSATECADASGYACELDFIGDGVCDEACNIAKCNLDGGDCDEQEQPQEEVDGPGAAAAAETTAPLVEPSNGEPASVGPQASQREAQTTTSTTTTSSTPKPTPSAGAGAVTTAPASAEGEPAENGDHEEGTDEPVEAIGREDADVIALPPIPTGGCRLLKVTTPTMSVDPKSQQVSPLAGYYLWADRSAIIDLGLRTFLNSMQNGEWGGKPAWIQIAHPNLFIGKPTFLKNMIIWCPRDNRWHMGWAPGAGRPLSDAAVCLGGFRSKAGAGGELPEEGGGWEAREDRAYVEIEDFKIECVRPRVCSEDSLPESSIDIIPESGAFFTSLENIRLFRVMGYSEACIDQEQDRLGPDQVWCWPDGKWRPDTEIKCLPRGAAQTFDDDTYCPFVYLSSGPVEFEGQAHDQVTPHAGGWYARMDPMAHFALYEVWPDRNSTVHSGAPYWAQITVGDTPRLLPYWNIARCPNGQFWFVGLEINPDCLSLMSTAEFLPPAPDLVTQWSVIVPRRSGTPIQIPGGPDTKVTCFDKQAFKGCGEPPGDPEAVAEIRKRTLSVSSYDLEILEYMCDGNDWPEGPDTRMCLPTGKWSSDEPTKCPSRR